jgi:hypothetical protein
VTLPPDLIDELRILNLRRRWHKWARRQRDWRNGKIGPRLRDMHLRLALAKPLWIEINWQEPEFTDW